mgnify:CR=1 FL=1
MQNICLMAATHENPIKAGIPVLQEPTFRNTCLRTKFQQVFNYNFPRTTIRQRKPRETLIFNPFAFKGRQFAKIKIGENVCF